MTEHDYGDEDVEFPDVEFDLADWEANPADLATSGGFRPLIPNVDHGPVEVWLRRPSEYMNVLREHPYSKFAFSRPEQRRGIHPHSLLRSVLPPDLNFEWVSLSRGYVLHFTRSGYEDTGEAVNRIPCWAYGNDPELLLRYCRNAQEHGYRTIAVGFLPRAVKKKPQQQRCLEWLYRVAADYPHIRFHYVFGSAWRHNFGLNFAACDINPAYVAKFNRILLPNGDTASKEHLGRKLKWIHVLGFSAADLQTYENRVRFNIAAALWAAEHYREAEPITIRDKRIADDPLGLLASRDTYWADAHARKRRPQIRQKLAKPVLDPDKYPQSSPDPEEPYHLAEPIKGAALVPVKPRHDTSRDKILCNSCSLAPSCKVYREGAICALTSSPTSRLAQMYGTRDVETVKTALSAVLAKMVERYERSASKFHDDEESDVLDLKRSEHLLKMETSLVRSTETFMKILDPSFRESNIPAINGNVTHIYNPNVLVANVVKELEAAGVTRDQLTPELIQQAIEAQPRVIEG